MVSNTMHWSPLCKGNVARVSLVLSYNKMKYLWSHCLSCSLSCFLSSDCHFCLEEVVKLCVWAVFSLFYSGHKHLQLSIQPKSSYYITVILLRIRPICLDWSPSLHSSFAVGHVWRCMCLLCAWCEIYFHSLLIKRRFSWPIKFLLAAWTSIPNYHHQIFHCMQNHIKLNQQRTPNPCKVRQTREQNDCFVLHGRGDFDWLIEYRPKYNGQYWHTNCRIE